jgi:tetratricopeptide (TPR) repeat protein
VSVDDAQALLDRACAAHERGQLQQAEELYRSALSARSDCVEALLGLGILLRSAGRLEEARECLAKCAVLAPQPSSAWLELGLTQVALSDREGALHAFASAVRSDPSLVGAHVNLGLTLAELNRPEPALTALTAALALKPGDAQILRTYALIALDAGKPDEAIQAAERAAAGLDAPAAASLLGLTHLCARRYDRAEREFRRALEAAPDAPELAVSLGATMEGAGRFDEAIEHYRAYLVRQPEQLHARFMLALLLLGKGELEEGWVQYAARPSAREPRKNLAPAVEARALTGKRVLVLTEQGIGDEVFFLRYVPLLRQLAQPEAIVYDASPRFRSVAGRIEALDGVSAQGMMPWWAGPKVLLADLPMLCRGAGQPGALPPPLRMAALPERLAQWRAALTAFGPGPYIAVNWQGGQAQRNAGQIQWFSRLQVKRIEPGLLGRALKGWPGTVVSVQQLPDAAEFEAFRGALGANVFDATRANDDIEDLLALLACVDELVGVSTTNVHLRGAVDRSARILVQYPPEWRWMQSGDQSAWYPGFSLYRQDGDLDWSGALARLRRDLSLQEQG